MSALVYTVYLTGKDGQVHAFGPGDSVPDWARARITNPLAWGDQAETAKPVAAEVAATQPKVVDESPVSHASGDDGPPPQGGPGASRKVWADYAASNGVVVDSTWKREDIIAACEKAGLPV